MDCLRAHRNFEDSTNIPTSLKVYLDVKICYVADFDKIFNVVLFSASSEIFSAVCKALPIGIHFDGLDMFFGGNMNSDDRLTSKLQVVFVVCFYTAEFKFARLPHAVLLTCIKLV